MSNKMPWFRAYTEMVDDEKLRLLAFEDRWHFVALLCLKGQGLLDEGGPLLMRKVAVKLGLSVREVEEVVRRLAEVGLVDQDSLQPLAWDARQMKSDSSAERVKAFRERKKQAGQSGGKTPEMVCNDDGNAQRNVTVTAQDTDTDTDTEEERVFNEQPFVGNVVTPQAPPAAAPTPTAPADCATTKRKTASSAGAGTRLPDGWKLPKSWGDWALEQRPDMTPADVRREADCFADYWHAVPGAKGRKADWLGTWRNWIRRSDGAAPSLRGGRGGPANPNKYAGAARAIFEGIEV